jgi:hypothetical protein
MLKAIMINVTDQPPEKQNYFWVPTANVCYSFKPSVRVDSCLPLHRRSTQYAQSIHAGFAEGAAWVATMARLGPKPVSLMCTAQAHHAIEIRGVYREIVVPRGSAYQGGRRCSEHARGQRPQTRPAAAAPSNKRQGPIRHFDSSQTLLSQSRTMKTMPRKPRGFWVPSRSNRCEHDRSTDCAYIRRLRQRSKCVACSVIADRAEQDPQ